MTDDLIARLREENEWTNQRPYFHAHAKPLHADERTAWLEKMREEYNVRYT